MLRLTLATLLALGVLSPRMAGSQELPPSLLTSQPAPPAGERPDFRARQLLADQALAAGLSATAAGLYAQSLADPKLGETDRELAGLGLTAAYLERTRIAETKAALRFLPKSPRKTLREGLLALLENDPGAAKGFAAELDLASLPAGEISWAHALRWMIAAAEGDNLNATLSQEAVTRTAVSEEQRQRIELLGYRAAILAGKAGGGTLDTLRALAKNARGTPLAFAYARNLAFALARAGDARAAAAALGETADLPPARRAEADLLAGLILGGASAEGRARLQAAARNPANVAIRLTALRALVAAADPRAENANATANETDYRAIANEGNDFLLRRRPGQLAYDCPRDPQVLDAIHLARAQLMLFAGNREKARQAAEELLKDVPASPLTREATRTLAIAAWGDGSYRLAATHLATLADGSVEPERSHLRVAAADCLFLAKDHGLAEKAYAGLQKDAADGKLAEAAFHQRVLCLLETADERVAWESAARTIEESARATRPPSSQAVWSAAWSLVEDARKSGRPAEASQLLARLTPLIVGARADYALRFEWQRALLAIAEERPAAAVSLADGIIRRLEDVPAGPELEPLRQAVPELRGHAALLKARTALNLGSARGLEELVELRRRFGKVPAAAASYLVEGRHLAANGRHAEAQSRFEALAKEYGDDKSLSEFAALGLYEAAEQAALQSPTGGEAKLKDAVELLERFAESHPQHPLFFRVSLRRAEILRSLGQFDKALLVLEALIRDRPTDPSRPQAEMARADTLFGLAQLRRDRNGQLDRQRVSRAAAAYERIAEAWTKDAPDAQVEAWYKWALSLNERAKAESGGEARASRQEARRVLLRPLAALRGAEAKSAAEEAARLSGDGRLWLARAILLTGELCELDGDVDEAVAAYAIIPAVNQGQPTDQARLPGQASAESKLAALRRSTSTSR
jgi:hypothetical protein